MKEKNKRNKRIKEINRKKEANGKNRRRGGKDENKIEES
jgi:hypothetical protein